MNFGWLKALGKVAPGILMFTPLAPIAPVIKGVVESVEGIPGATGAQKKEIAKQVSLATANIINSVMGAEKINPQAVSDTVGSAIDTVVNATNIAHKEDK